MAFQAWKVLGTFEKRAPGLAYDMRTNPFPSREEPALSQVGKWCDLLQWALQPRSQGPLLPVPWSEREREGEDLGTRLWALCSCTITWYKMDLEGFSVQSLLYDWSSCFHGQVPTPCSFLLVLLLQWNNVLLRRYFTVHRCIPLDETIRICLDKLYSLPDPLMYNFEDIITVCYQKESLKLFLMANSMRKLMV